MGLISHTEIALMRHNSAENHRQNFNWFIFFMNTTGSVIVAQYAVIFTVSGSIHTETSINAYLRKIGKTWNNAWNFMVFLFPW